ncbi:MAG: zinc ribbon domain-containing protein [Candidatus Verstraetearchaeota archaeon]|nr:zinc ribbon domain-containing protein [Candidatus Verstraetearchaeota archaeon]
MSEQKFCKYCGAPLPEGSTYCPKCGKAVAEAARPPPPPPRGECFGERAEKEEKGEKHEKGEKGRGGDMVGAIFGGGVLVWLGITFWLAQSGTVSWTNWWAYFLAGIGALLIIQGVLRVAMRGSTYEFSGLFIGGAILLIIGLAFVYGTTIRWYYILILLGILVIVMAIFGMKRTPRP